MKTIITFLFLTSSILFGQNGDFESWTAGVPDFWTTIDNKIIVAEETSIVHGGSSSASINVIDSIQANTDIRQSLNVLSGNVYNFSVFVYHTEGNVRARLYLGDYESYSDSDIKNAWQEMTDSYTATADSTIEIGLRFYDKTGFDGAEIVYVDDFTVNGGVLPVELTSFFASVKNSNVILLWETATEINNYGFDIERKVKNGDWARIGFKEGFGNSNSIKYYEFFDNSIEQPGKYFYRLKQVDIDGTYEYSDEIEVEFNILNNFDLFQNYPNPFNPNTIIKFSIPSESYVKLKIFNMLGEEISVINKNFLKAGNHSLEFNGSNLASGMYFYKLEANELTKIKKMIILK